MSLTQEQINEVTAFQFSLSDRDEWLFYHLAWANGETDIISFKDKYSIMQRWEELLGVYNK